MNNPPDPGDTVPPVGCNVTIVSNESGVETDSFISNRVFKRSRFSKIYKHCNKRRRKHNTDIKPTDCQCLENEPVNKKTNDDITPQISVNTVESPRPTSVARNLYESTDSACCACLNGTICP